MVYVEGHLINAGSRMDPIHSPGAGYPVVGLCNEDVLTSDDFEDVRITASRFITNTQGAMIEPGVGGRVILTAPNFKVHQGGVAIANYGILRTPDTDTYTLAISDTLSWVSGLPPTATVPALGLDTLTFTVTVPVSPTADLDEVVVSAVSQSNPAVTASHEMEVYIPTWTVYLPLVLKNQ